MEPIRISYVYEQGPESGEMLFLVRVIDGAPGSEVAFQAKVPNPSGPIELPRTKLPESTASVGISRWVEAGYRSEIVVSYWPAGALGPQFELRFDVLFAPPVAASAVPDEPRSDPSEAIRGKVEYVQGAEGGEMAFMVMVYNGATGADIEFHATTPNPGGSDIRLPRTRINRSNFTAGMVTRVNAGYKTEIEYAYHPNGTVVPSDLQIGLYVVFVVESDVEPRTGLQEDPLLPLNLSLENPMINNTAQAGVSFDTSAPVLNTLNLLIQNPTDQPVIQFENVGELGPDDPLPSIDQPYEGPRLDRLYVYFPWGSTGGTLTTKELAASITLSPAPGNMTWDVVKQSSPNVGTNWILFPKLQAFLRPTESVAFVFTGVKTFNPALTLTHMRLKKQVTGYVNETEMKPELSLVDAQPKILSFEASQNNVAAGTTVNFSWTTWAAKNCTFDGQPGLASSVNAYPVFVTVSRNYRLEGISASDKSTSEYRSVDVQPVKINSFTATPPQGSRIGEAVTLDWNTFSAVTQDIAPEVGVVCENAAGCNAGQRVVYPSARTVYTLTATGGTSQAKAKVTVFPLPKGWLKTTPTAPWSTTGKPVLLTYDDQLVYLAGGSAYIYTSLEGTTWRTISSNAPWANRTFAFGAVFNGGDGAKMWLMGGQEGANVSADVYASTKPDSAGWTVVTSAPGWSARSNAGCLVWGGKLWIVGGSDGKGGGFNDVWNSSNGKDWTRVTEHADWSPRWAVAFAAFSNRLWIFGGQIGPNAGDVTNEVWSSTDGVKWIQWPAPSWNPRSYSNAQVFGDRLFLFGGARTSTIATDDLYRLMILIKDGKEVLEWALQPTQAMGNSAAMATTMLAGGAWLAGGWSAPQGVAGPNKSVWLFAPVPL